ncbi:MAG TPA: group II intron maturase-specific domain-containing protein, partial [Ramlibacter sp.]|nr:group II intron maturase-specific domain-containing protein [Ramlibacter sp.]
DLPVLGRSVHVLHKGDRRRRPTTLSRSVQVGEFEVALGGGIWVAVRDFRKYRGTMLIKPSRKNAQALYDKVTGVIKECLMRKQADLIEKLNPILRGWAQYHHPVVAKETFNKLDSLIYWRLVRWARRRHPQKNRAWCFQKYWGCIENRTEFVAVKKMNDGTRFTVRLYRLSDRVIIRHQKIMGDYNPFDPRWEMYGEELRGKRMLQSISYRRQLSQLYMSQSGNCVLCGTAITRETGWHDHHIVRRVDGGSNLLSNRVLLHPVCHAKVHARGLTVVKPAS